MLRSNVVLVSFAALSTAGFVGLATTGARHGCRASLGGQDALSTDPHDKTEERRLSGNRAAFSLDTF